GWFGAPTMLFFGVVRGLGQTAPHSVIPNFVGALIGKFYFERKFGREWRKMIPVVSSGFFVGTGLVSILSVGVVFLCKAVSTAAY
ncbi:MAG: OPT/YSL family transporter, partial [Kiritimatiellia bacterium]